MLDSLKNQTLTAQNWSRLVEPGSSVVMSILLLRFFSNFLFFETFCPGISCSGKWPKTNTSTWETYPPCRKHICNTPSLYDSEQVEKESVFVDGSNEYRHQIPDPSITPPEPNRPLKRNGDLARKTDAPAISDSYDTSTFKRLVQASSESLRWVGTIFQEPPRPGTNQVHEFKYVSRISA